MAVRFPAGANLCPTVAAPCISLSPLFSSSFYLPKISKDCRSVWSSAVVHVTSHRFSSSGGCNVLWQRCGRLRSPSSVVRRRSLVRSRVRGSVEPLGSASDPKKMNGRSRYHPSEDIAESTSESCEDARLTNPEITRTIIEVNTKATLLFPGLSDGEIEQNVLWPELPYVTDEHGNIYFQVNNDEDFLQNLTSETNMVQVLIGLDTMEMMNELGVSGPTDIDFGMEEIEAEDSDDEDINEEDEDEDEDEDDSDSDSDEEDDDEDDGDWSSAIEDLENDSDDESLGDWAKLETMRYSHPLFFARRLTEAASDNTFDMMEQPPAGLAIQGILRPAFIEEHSIIKRHIAGLQSSKPDKDKIDQFAEDKLEDYGINGHGDEQSGFTTIWPEEKENNETPIIGTTFYKLEMSRITLLSAQGHPINVEIEDFAKAKPDAIAHSAAKIMSRLNAYGEKITQALKSLCWRCKGIQVEEATLAGIDTLGLDVRVCSGTQIQTLRFPFGARASSEYSAESQINDLLFPRSHNTTQKKKQTNQNES